jgi:uncharacterized protein
MNVDMYHEFSHMLNALSTPPAFLELHLEERELSIIQTHLSAVILTPERVYKLKKPKNFGFCDYSTPPLRRHFCLQEVYLNTSLAPGVYLGVAPVLRFAHARWCFGPVTSEADLPLPGQKFLGGVVCDYAVVMRRLPDQATLQARVSAGTATAELLAEVARSIAAFHKTAPTSQHITDFGQQSVIRANWEENFRQMERYIGRTLDQACYEQIVHYVRAFLEKRAALFEIRMRDGRIRDCHGDVRLEHVYLLGEGREDAFPYLALLDRIEFNERFRYGDVASEVAFLTMELEASSRADLAQVFADTYAAEAHDASLYDVLPFYSCYRACVRAKVTSFQLDETEIAEAQRGRAQTTASALFALAASYAHGPTRPTVLMLGGLMGTGKSTLAQVLHQELGWTLCSSDVIRKQLAQLDPTIPREESYNQGLYRPAWTAQTYAELRERMIKLLTERCSVILDASFIHRADRQAIARAAFALEVNVVFIECTCPRALAVQRLVHRWHQRQADPRLPGTVLSLASDGRPDLYDTQQAVQEAFVEQEEPEMLHRVVLTTQPVSCCVEQIVDVLALPRLICTLYSGRERRSVLSERNP